MLNKSTEPVVLLNEHTNCTRKRKRINYLQLEDRNLFNRQVWHYKSLSNGLGLLKYWIGLNVPLVNSRTSPVISVSIQS